MTMLEPEKSGPISVTDAVVISEALKPRRRSPGEGTVLEYQTGAGPRFAIKYTARMADGTRRAVMRRGFTTRRKASAELRKVLAEIDAGSYIASSRTTTGSIWRCGWTNCGCVRPPWRRTGRMSVCI
jgi:hypothetical protein